jgi:pilus assembly protein FimV
MLKKLPLALMMGAALSASNAYGLGVGDIKVDSALNQRLDAEIELISSTEGELDEVTVSLGSAKAFERINLNRPYHLTSIEFKVTTRADGTPIVKLTSTETIREPFLDFLVEVNWPKGHMLREYTVLLDPPVAFTSQPSAPKPMVSEPGETQSVADPSSSTDTSGFPGDSLGYPGDTASQPSYTGDTYGPIAAQQTLWNVASQVRSGDVTTQQMMLALFDANPEAFIDGDIHHLKKGSILRIPDHNTIVGRDRADAIAEVRQVNSSLDLSSTMETTSEKPGMPESMASTSPTPESISDTKPELTIVAAGDTAASAAAASSDVKALKRELALASESMASQKMENEELKSRLQELESTISEMSKLKRLLEVQNAEMQQLQEQLAGAQVVEKPAEPVTMAEPEPVAELPEEVTPKESMQPAEQPSAVEPAAEVAPKPAPVKKVLPAPVQKEPMDIAMDYVNKIKNDPTLLGALGAVLVVLIALIALVFKRKGKGEDEEPVPVVEEAVVEEAKPSIFAGLKEKLQGLSKKKEKSEATEEIDFAEIEDAVDKTDPGVSAAAEGPSSEDITDTGMVKDEGGVDDMTFEDDVSAPSPEETQEATTVDATQEAASDEADPLEEVDVYEAFGDYEQAAEIVKQAIVDYPDNNSFKLRLFKVYESGGLKAEFSQAAVDHKDAMMDSPEWGEVEQMGKVFAPDSPAWGGGGTAPAADLEEDMSATMVMDSDVAAEATADAGESLDFGDLDFEFGDASDDTAESGEMDDATQVDVQATDTAAMDTEATQALDESANVAVAAGGDSNSLEFDMDSMDFEEATSKEEALESSEPVTDEIALDLGDMDFEEASGSAEALETAEPESTDEMALDLGDMDFDEASGSEQALETEEPESSDADNSLEFDLGDLGAELQADEPAGETAEEPEPAGNELEFDLGGMDLGTTEEPAVETADSAASDDISMDDDMSMDFELDDLSADSAPDSEDPTVMFADEQSSADETPSLDESADTDISDFSFDVDETSSEEPELGLNEIDDSLGQSLSAEGDEVATKLDLARAYIDMGDSDGAKGILDEVIAEGNDAQKAEAEELLQSA